MRPNRQQPAETAYHVSTHGNDDRGAIFADDRDRDRFLAILADAVDRSGWHLHAYCLMDTHYHLLVYTPEVSLAAGMWRLNTIYAQTHNRRHGRRGHLFRERYWSTPIVTDGHLLQVMRYIPLNPVAAGACAEPAEWRWSSYRATAGLIAPPSYLHVDWTRGFFGAETRSACARYRAFIAGEC